MLRKSLMLASLLAALSGVAHSAVISTFSGADVGEGLDLDGTFPYAIDLGNFGGATIRNATFTNWITTPGFVSTGNPYGGATPDFAGTDSANDDALEATMLTGNFANPTFNLTFSNLAPAASYKVQLLFMETFGTARAINIDFRNDGSNEVTGLNPLGNQTGDAQGPGTLVSETLNPTPGGQIVIRFTSTLSVPFVNDVTLEALPEPASAGLLAAAVGAMMLRRRRKA